MSVTSELVQARREFKEDWRGFDAEKVFLNSLFLEGTLFLTRAALDLVAMLEGVGQWFVDPFKAVKKEVGTMWYENKLAALMDGQEFGFLLGDKSLSGFHGHVAPFSVEEVYEWLVWAKANIGGFAARWLPSDKFLDYIERRVQGASPEEAGNRPDDESPLNIAARWLLYDHLGDVAFMIPILLLVMEMRRYQS